MRLSRQVFRVSKSVLLADVLSGIRATTRAPVLAAPYQFRSPPRSMALIPEGGVWNPAGKAFAQLEALGWQTVCEFRQPWSSIH